MADGAGSPILMSFSRLLPTVNKVCLVKTLLVCLFSFRPYEALSLKKLHPRFCLGTAHSLVIGQPLAASAS